MHFYPKLIFLVSIQILNFRRVSAAPVNATVRVRPTSAPVSPVHPLVGHNCISLWDVDANVIKHARKDQHNGYNRQKRLDVNGKLKKVSKDFIKKIDKNKADEKRKQKRSSSVNLVCVKTDKGVQCRSNTTDVIFNGADISDDVIKEGIQALLSNGALISRESKKKIRNCGDAVTTASLCSTQLTSCEALPETTADECEEPPEPTERSTTLAPCQKKLDDARTDIQDTTPEFAETVCDKSAVNSRLMQKLESIGRDKTELDKSTMFLECTAEGGANPSVYTCRWKHKNLT